MEVFNTLNRARHHPHSQVALAPSSQCWLGQPLARKELRADKLFLTVGISPISAFRPNISEVTVKQAMIRSARDNPSGRSYFFLAGSIIGGPARW
jgi:hypothetical protein